MIHYNYAGKIGLIMFFALTGIVAIFSIIGMKNIPEIIRIFILLLFIVSMGLLCYWFGMFTCEIIHNGLMRIHAYVNRDKK